MGSWCSSWHLIVDGSISTCFLNLILIPINSFLLILFGSHRLRSLSHNRDPVVFSRWKIRIHFFEVCLCMFCALFPLMKFSILILTEERELSIVVANFSYLASWIFCTFIILKEYNGHARHNWVVRSYWTISFVLSGLSLQSAIKKSEISVIIDSVYLLATLMLATSGLYLNGTETNYEMVREDDQDFGFLPSKKGYGSSNFFSNLSFSWLNPLLGYGFMHPLEQRDLYDLPEKYSSKFTFQIFEKNWDQEKQKRRPRLSRALFNSFGYDFLLIGLIKFVHDVILFIGPFLLQQIIIFSQKPEEPVSIGFFFAILMFISSVAQACLLQQYFFHGFNMGSKIKGALVGSLYKKTFILSQKSKTELTVGEIVNLQSVDAQMFQDITPYLHLLWSAPLQLSIGIFMLYQLLGPSCFAGLGIFVVLGPIIGWISSKLIKFQSKVMTFKDERTKLMNEILNGIRIIKFFVWEDSFTQKVNKIRDNELDILRRSIVIRALSTFFWMVLPILVGVLSFTAYTLSGHTLTAEKAFTALAVFNIIEFPLNAMPLMIGFLIELKVSSDRIYKFLLAEELDIHAVEKTTQKKDFAIEIEGGSFQWTSDKLTLKNITLKIPPGQLIGIVGSVGAGKSSLLASILGEIPKITGRVSVNGSIAYCSQHAWIQNASLRDNILFGKPYDEKRYQQVIKVCELLPDFDILANGDLTEIGEKGINLSGGQKQRVAIARAVYQDQDIILFDDVLSAVDVHVGAAIFKNCIHGILKNKTRILVTHQLQILPKTDLIVFLKDGEISEIGTYDKLMDSQKEFYSLIKSHVSETLKENEQKKSEEEAQHVDKKNDEDGKIIADEDRAIGSVDLQVWKVYAYAFGGIFFVMLILISFTIGTSLDVSIDIWLSIWSSFPESHSLNFYLIIYAILAIGAGSAIFFETLIFGIGGLRASKTLHSQMLETIFHVPISFFDSTPIGRILNRFSKDQYTVDIDLPENIGSLVFCIFSVFAIFAVVSYVTPFFLLGLLPLSYLYRFVQRYYMYSSRELRRLESISRSPINAQMSETINGLSTIRSYDKENEFIFENFKKLDTNLTAYQNWQATNRWLGVRLQSIGACVVFLSISFIILERNSLAAGYVGLSINYCLGITSILEELVRVATSTENQLISVERIKAYIDLPREAKYIIPETQSRRNWPDNGKIKFENVKMRYREGLDLVLKGLSFEIMPREKIGIVGRTGAGKSSIMLALFRLVELVEGRILIDDIDISKIGLKDLRSKLCIIPQEPTLFTGSIRTNLDPFEEHTDSELWSILESVHLKNTIENLPEKLETTVVEHGGNFSAGEKQLLCLARALLKKTKIMILDEATASIDFQTDKLIQQAIRKDPSFRNVTVLTIAHRLNTIMDYDRILVMDEGKIAEFDSPSTLLKNPQSLFFEMVNQASSFKQETMN